MFDNYFSNKKPKKPIRVMRYRKCFSIRMAKETQALKTMFGYESTIAYDNCFSAHRDLVKGCFKHVCDLKRTSSRGEKIRILKKYVRAVKPDIIIAHQEPNSAYTLMREVVGDSLPIVFSVHDMSSYRRPHLSCESGDVKAEKAGFETAQGIIVIAEEVMKFANMKYNIKAPWMALHGYVPQDWIPKDPLPKRKNGIHFVYEGGMVNSNDSPTYQYRYYLPLFKELMAQGIHVHAYGGNRYKAAYGDYLEERKNNKLFHFHYQVPYLKLLKEMTQFHYGLVGFNFRDTNPGSYDFLNNTTPNKYWEYIAAGVIPVIINFKGCIRLANRYGIGIKCKNLNRVKLDIKKYKGEKDLANNKYSKSIVMENYIWKLDRFFRKIIKEFHN